MQECNHKSVDLTLLEDTLAQYADVKGSLITILQKTQDIYGYIPIDAVYRISERTGASPAKILGVATFYSQFRFQAVGQFMVMLCKGTACYVNGAERIADAVMDELGIRDNQTTDDGLFSLSLVSCLGCCSLAPVMMINDKVYGSLTPDKARKILRDLSIRADRIVVRAPVLVIFAAFSQQYQHSLWRSMLHGVFDTFFTVQDYGRRAAALIEVCLYLPAYLHRVVISRIFLADIDKISIFRGDPRKIDPA